MTFKEFGYLSRKAKEDKTTSIIYCVLLFSFNILIAIPYYIISMDVFGLLVIYLISLFLSNLISKSAFVLRNNMETSSSDFEPNKEYLRMYKYTYVSKKRHKENKRMFRRKRKKYLFRK